MKRTLACIALVVTAASVAREHAPASNPVLQQTMASFGDESEPFIPSSAATASNETDSAASAKPYDNEYHLTIIEDQSILRRLSEELKEVRHTSRHFELLIEHVVVSRDAHVGPEFLPQ